MRTPRRSHRNAAWVAAWVALSVMVGGATCPRKGPGDAALRPVPVIHVVFKGGCPDDAAPASAAGPFSSCGKRCVQGPNKQELVFQAWSQASGDIQTDFELQFDPFKNAPIKSSNGTTRKLKLDVDMPKAALTGTKKHFTFNVASGTCDVLDPEIIVVK